MSAHIRFSDASNSHHAKPDERIYNKLMLVGGGGGTREVSSLVSSLTEKMRRTLMHAPLFLSSFVLYSISMYYWFCDERLQFCGTLQDNVVNLFKLGGNDK